jgi:hypothetical protein
MAASGGMGGGGGMGGSRLSIRISLAGTVSGSFGVHGKEKKLANFSGKFSILSTPRSRNQLAL